MESVSSLEVTENMTDHMQRGLKDMQFSKQLYMCSKQQEQTPDLPPEPTNAEIYFRIVLY